MAQSAKQAECQLLRDGSAAGLGSIDGIAARFACRSCAALKAQVRPTVGKICRHWWPTWAVLAQTIARHLDPFSRPMVRWLSRRALSAQSALRFSGAPFLAQALLFCFIVTVKPTAPCCAAACITNR